VPTDAHEPETPDCLAGHVRLELRNVGKNYPFERSRRFPGILANSSPRDYSLLSWAVGRRSSALVPRSQPGFSRGRSVIEAHRRIIKNFRRPPIEQHHGALCAGLFPPTERVWWSRPASLTACSSLPRQRPSASAGFRWWRRDIAPTRLRGVLACPRASVREFQRRSLPPKSARRQLAAESPAIAKRERTRNRRGCLHC
jgi:hypothetical protein